MAERHTQRYDFDCAPLYSMRAFVRDKCVDLVFVFHYVILDGWSVANLIRELVQDYLFRLGIDVPPIDTEVHSATLLAEHARLEKEAVESSAAQQFWRRRWRDPVRRRWNPTSPTKRPRPPRRM